MTSPAGVQPQAVDAHVHLWDLATGDYPWNTAELGPAHASFDAATAGRTIASAGVDRAVLVQAADTVGDSERMFAAAGEHDWVAGVVAWVPMEDPAAAERLLDRWAATGRLSGVRQLVHNDPDPDLLDAPTVRATVSMLAARGLPLDVPDAWPRLWPALTRLVDDLPGLRVVLDHLGKPPLGLDAEGHPPDDGFARWARDLRVLAGHPSVVAKLSGLGSVLRPGVPPAVQNLTPLVDVALEAFGTDRLLFGGDWPMSLATATYRDLVNAVRGCLAELTDAEQDALLRGTANRVYGLERQPERAGA